MRSLFAAILLTAIAAPAFAQSGTPGIDRRQAVQERRIDQGVASGSLSRHEARRLDRGQRKVKAMEHKAKRDGVVTRRERARIQAAQDRQGDRIARQKQDANRF